MLFSTRPPLIRRSRAIALAAVLATLMGARTAGAQRNGVCTPRHPMVEALEFRGNRAIATAQLAAIIDVENSSFARRRLGWSSGTLTCLDSLSLLDDARRIADYYRVRGFPTTTTSVEIVRRRADRAQVRFLITEATPIRIAALTVDSVPVEAADVPKLRRRLLGAVADSAVLGAVVDSLQRLIRTAGYANAAAPDTVTTVDPARHEARVHWTFHPRTVATIGTIRVVIDSGGRRAALRERDIRALLGFSSGDRYSERRLVSSQRGLFDLDLYRSAVVSVDSSLAVLGSGPRARDTVPIVIRVAEGERQRTRVGGGWGTNDCFRAQAMHVEQSLMGHGERFQADLRLSKLGMVAPMDGLRSLCPSVREDPFSQRLNYYVGASLAIRGVVGRSLRPEFTLYSERRSQVSAYEQSTTLGAAATITREIAPQTQLSAQYRFTAGQTIADRAVSCFPFGFCRVEDLPSFLEVSPTHSIGVGIVKAPLLPTANPVSGTRWQAEIKLAHADVARRTALNFARLMAEGAAYQPLGDSWTLAVRGQIGFVLLGANSLSLLPPAERFYSGGQSSVRGFDENSLGPGSYIVTAFDTVAGSPTVGVAPAAGGFSRIAPSGGNAMWLANIELRSRMGLGTEFLNFVLFVDAGRVWNTTDVFSALNAGARITPGVGLRLQTPIGPVRMDVGYNPYDYEAGSAFFLQTANTATNTPGRAICVSPGTTEPLVSSGSSAGTSCPASFTPTKGRSLFSHLKVQFSIGNAF